MDNNLNVLEAKVLEAVELIKDLRRENTRLAAQNSELSSQHTDLESRLAAQGDEVERLGRELAEAEAQAGTIANYEEKRQEIEEKVGGLLAKLEALG